MAITYRQLFESLLHEDDMDSTVTVYDGFSDEFYPVASIERSHPDAENGDVLDPDHPYLYFMTAFNE
jgi:hypothetical protein